MVGGPEACDDGNVITEDACPYGTASCTICNATCTAELPRIGNVCGDGVRGGPEVCDDGNQIDESACPYGQATCTPCNATCTATLTVTGNVCGDGVVGGPEACDDGNADACGTCSANCQLVTSHAATGFIYPEAGAVLLDGDTFTIDDGIHSLTTTFEFTQTTAAPGNVPIVYVPADDRAAMQAKIIEAINGVGDTLLVTASVGISTLVQLEHDRPTSLGNRPVVENVSAPYFAVVGMSGGAGGNCASGVACTTDADCASNNCQSNICQ